MPGRQEPAPRVRRRPPGKLRLCRNPQSMRRVRESRIGNEAGSEPALRCARDSAARPAEKIKKGEKQNPVAPRAGVNAASARPVVHRVKPGETLYSIARNYQTTVEALRSGNRFLLNRSLEAGDTLRIPATP